MRLLLFVLVLSMLLLGAVVWRGTRPSPVSLPLVPLRVGNIGEYSLLNLIADRQGFFRENGLAAEIVEYDSGPPCVADLLEGKVDVAIAADFVGVSNFFEQNDLRILAQVSKHHVFQVIARKDKGIQEPEDLEGKRIGVTRLGAGEFFLGRFLTLHDLSLEDVQVVDLPASELAAKILNGDLDAIVIFDPRAYEIMQALNGQAVLWSAQDDKDTFAVAYSTQPYILAHSDIIARYIRSLVQAEEYLKAHDRQSQQFMADVLGYEDTYVQHVWPQFDFTVALEQSLLLTMEDEAQWVIENQLTDATTVPNYLERIYFEALESVKPDSVTIFH